MRYLMWSIFMLLTLAVFASGSPYIDNDYDYDAENSDVLEDKASGDDMASKGSELELLATPKFVTSPQSIIVNEGDTVRLPCMVERLEGFVLLWKRNMDIVTVASQQSVGQYSCTANNSLGEATATSDISGDAHPA